jgi:uncharacterized membrane protein
MNRSKKISFLTMLIGFTLLLVAAFTVTYVSDYKHASTENPALIPVYPYAQYSIFLMVIGAVLVSSGLIYKLRNN